MKNFFLRNLIEKYLKERDVSQRNTALTHLGFIVDEDLFDNLFEDFEILIEYGRELGLQRKDIKIFSFVKTKRKIPSLRQDQITNKEFSWRGEVVDQNAIDFLDYPFDVLIGLYKNDHKYLDVMAAQSKAKFKIGFEDVEPELYDLILNVDFKETSLFKSEVTRCLKALNKV